MHDAANSELKQGKARRATCISAKGCKEARACRRRALLRGFRPTHFSLKTPHPLEIRAWHLHMHDPLLTPTNQSNRARKPDRKEIPSMKWLIHQLVISPGVAH